MSPEIPPSPTAHETPSILREAPFIAPMLLPVCCLCGLIRDDRGSSTWFARWLTPQTYRITHSVELNDCSLTHTYCPTCFTKVRDTAAQYSQ